MVTSTYTFETVNKEDSCQGKLMSPSKWNCYDDVLYFAVLVLAVTPDS